MDATIPPFFHGTCLEAVTYHVEITDVFRAGDSMAAAADAG